MILDADHNPFAGDLYFRAFWRGYSLGLVERLNAKKRTVGVRYDLGSTAFVWHLMETGEIPRSEQKLEQHRNLHQTGDIRYLQEQDKDYERFRLPKRATETPIEFDGKTYSRDDMRIEFPYDAVLVYGTLDKLKKWKTELPAHWIRQHILRDGAGAFEWVVPFTEWR